MPVSSNLVTIFVLCYFRTKVIEGLIPQGIQVQAQVTLALADATSREIAHACVDQCVSAVTPVEVPVLVYFRSSCIHVIEVGGP